MIIVESILIAVILTLLLPIGNSLFNIVKRRLRRHTDKKVPADTDARSTLLEMLTRLQCEAHPLHDGENSATAPLTFDYQGGHFIATFPDKDEAFANTASISFFSCFSCRLEFASAAERTCNEVNSMVLPVKCTLSSQDEEGDPIVMSLHTSGVRLIDDAQGLELLKTLLGCFFHVQRTIAERFEAIKEEEPGDILLNRQPYVKSLYALAHAELNEQPEEWKEPWYETPRWTIDELTERLTGHRVDFDYDIVANGEKITDTDGFNPFSTLFNSADEQIADSSTIVLVPRTRTADTPAAISIFMTVTSIEDRLYKVRIDYTQPGLPLTPYRPESGIESEPDTRSVTMGIHRGGPELFKAEAEYMAGEEGLIDRCLSGDAAYSLYWGRALFADGRFLEAEHYLRNAFSIMRKPMEEPEKQKPEVCSTFYELCYFLGVVYYQLGRYRESYYYLDIIVQQHRLRWTQQYVLTMMALGDPRVPSLLKQLSDMTENVEQDETIEELKAFIHRQNIIYDIRNGRIEEARAALEKMLADDNDSAFALHWLSKLI